jgi:hypothetical protein
MTDETTQALLPVKVTQADRDLIVTLMRPLAKSAIEHKAIDFIAEGRGDDAEAVQLVAKHRLAHSRPSQASDAGEDVVEKIARLIDPSSWAVFDAEKARMLRKYKGENIGWPADQYQHKASMDTARRILATLTAPPTSELVDAKQADTLHSAYIASLDSLTLPTSGERMRLREAAQRALSILERNLHRQTEKCDDAVRILRAALTKGAE